MNKLYIHIYTIDIFFQNRLNNFFNSTNFYLKGKMWEVVMKFKNVVCFHFQVLFSKCTFLRLQHFFSHSTYTINSIFSAVVRIYNIRTFDDTFFLLAIVAMITEKLSFCFSHSNYCQENKFFQHNYAAYQFKISLKKRSRKGVSFTPLLRTQTLLSFKMQQKLLFWISITI